MQPKLTIGPVNDVYEQEADRVAEQVMRMPDSSIQGEHDHLTAGVNIQCISDGGSSGMNTSYDIQLNQSGGHPLSPITRRFMEPRFGVDFSQVRVHAGNDAHQTASQIQARAFTHGKHIWLGNGESERDKGLIAHELTHVIQQGHADNHLKPGAQVISQSGSGLVQRYSHQDCDEALDLRPHIWPADRIAKNMVSKAIRVLSASPINPAVTPLFAKYFMSNTPSIATILGVYRAIKDEFDDDGYQYECEDDCDQDELAYVYGLWTDIHLCMNYWRGKSNTCLARTIVHEFAHYTESLDDEAYCKSGCAYSRCPASLSPDDALDNADSFACFAWELYPMAI